MCRVLEVSRSGFYDWEERRPSDRQVRDARLLELIEAIHEQSRRTYGAPRIHAELKYSGVKCGRKRVARLMRCRGIQGVHRRKRGRTTQRDESASPAPDLVDRKFVVDEPNRLWFADITYVSTWDGWLYVAIVLDLFSRRIVGWSMADHLRTELVTDALEMAIAHRSPGHGLIHHSDRGCQYTSYAFGRRCREAGIEPSMGSKGDAYDNAIAESFFATLETELLWTKTFHNRTEARLAIFDYIEAFYNPMRRHSSLGDVSPLEYERRFEEKRFSLDPLERV